MHRTIGIGLLMIALASPAAFADSQFRAARGDRGERGSAQESSGRQQQGPQNRNPSRGDRPAVNRDQRDQRDRRAARGDTRRAEPSRDQRAHDQRTRDSRTRDRAIEHRRDDWRRDARPSYRDSNQLRYSGDPRPRVDLRGEQRVPRVVHYGTNSYRSDWRDNRGRHWQYDRGWYDRYRVQYFRYDRGRYFARDRFSIGLYFWPSGHQSRVWIAGEWLPSVYWSSRYYINDYGRYALYEPPHWGRWVRVGNDALLIDRDNGEILDVVYDLYW